MRYTHECAALHALPPLPANATMAEFIWKCPECKQWWRIRQHRTSATGERCFPRRYMKVK